MRLPFRKREAPPVDPSRPHPFREIDDAGLAASSSGGFQGMGYGVNYQAVMTGNFMRKQRCGVAGCGRDRHDPIHEADPGS